MKIKHYMALFLCMFIVGCEAEGKKAEHKEPPLHPDFTITMKDLKSVVKDLPPVIGDEIIARPMEFLELMKQALDLPSDIFVLVDKKHPLPANYEPPDLVLLKDYGVMVNKKDLAARKIIIPDAIAMVRDAKKEGIDIVFSSAYRSFAYQERLFQRNVTEMGKEKAERESAEAGKSQHQLGVAVDFGSITDDFAFTQAGIWLKNNAWKYGFSLSYPEGLEELTGYRYESWHYRYLTKLGTRIERTFFRGVQQYFLQFFHDQADYLRAAKVKK